MKRNISSHRAADIIYLQNAITKSGGAVTVREAVMLLRARHLSLAEAEYALTQAIADGKVRLDAGLISRC